MKLHLTKQVLMAIALGTTASLTSISVAAQPIPITATIVAQESSPMSMNPEQMRQHYIN